MRSIDGFPLICKPSIFSVHTVGVEAKRINSLHKPGGGFRTRLVGALGLNHPRDLHPAQWIKARPQCGAQNNQHGFRQTRCERVLEEA